MLMKSIKRIGVVYALASIVLGPVIFGWSLGRGKIGGDCSDPTWDSVSKAAKAAYYHEAATIMTISSSILLLIGGIIIFKLLSKPSDAKRILIAVLVGLMMVGYALMLASANSWNC